MSKLEKKTRVEIHWDSQFDLETAIEWLESLPNIDPDFLEKIRQNPELLANKEELMKLLEHNSDIDTNSTE